MREVTLHPSTDERHRTVYVVHARKANRCSLCGNDVVIGSRIVFYGNAVAHVECDLRARRTREL
jgi:hypothetical protein